MSAQLALENLGLLALLMLALWVVSVRRRDASLVDPWWSIGFLLVTAHTAARTGLTPGKTLLLALLSVWAVRLWAYLLLRARGRGEDPRYAALRQRWGPERFWWVSLFLVFGLQGALIGLISAPLQLAAAAPAPDPIGAWDLGGAALFAVGFVWEALADAQLAAFRRDPARRGQVLDTGLWRWSRHPNYFGEALLQWGLWMCALDRPGGLVCVGAPLLMTWLLLRVSGVTMLDAHLLSTRPGYAEYVRRTPAFFPRPPR